MRYAKKLSALLLTALMLLTAVLPAGAEFYDEANVPLRRRTAIDYAAGKGIVAGEDPYCWQLKVPMDRKGYKNHPTVEGEAQYAKLLADFIRNEVKP